MEFNYRNYVTRYKYQPYCWPPDLSLSELHGRCSEPGPINEEGVQCPCCQQWSKKKVRKWWKRNIDEDLKQFGAAIPGYFQLIKYYAFFSFLIILLNSIYPIYATYYTCNHLDPNNQYCLEVGALYYLEFTDLIDLLNTFGRQDMINILMILQTAVFYILLSANYFSIIYITFLNDSAKRQFHQLKTSQSNRCLVFYNIPRKVAQNLQTLLKGEEDQSINIIKSFQIYQIKRYYDSFTNRNKIYYYLLSLYVIAQNPFRLRNLNKQLQQFHHNVLQEKEKIGKFNNKIIVMFENIEESKLIHRVYKIKLLQKWWIGVRSLLDQFKIKSFDNTEIPFSTYQIGLGSDIMWQNLGEQLGVKMATKIKTFFVAIVFIILCYVVLYYPILFSLKTHIKAETKRFVKLNTFQKILPNLTAFALVALSIYFRVYMQKLSEQRNPKDQLQRSRFVLITCLTFHILFYVIIPTIFFMYPGEINDTVKLYVISEQARTFIVVQVVIVFVDLPYRIWKNKKIKALSDQRIAFRSNQSMLHRVVECRDYPLEIRLQVLFRIWSLVLFYSFFIPYIMFYIVVAFFAIFWIEKNNLYKHYTVRRKVSIKLESDTLMYYVNFFCVYLCFVYCFTVRGNTIKIIVAIIVTLVGLIANIVYWLILNKGQTKTQQYLLNNSMELSKQVALLKKQKLNEEADKFVQNYHLFLQSIQNDKLDEEISLYLKKFRQYQKNHRQSVKKHQSIELPAINTESAVGEELHQKQQSQNQEALQNQQFVQNDQHF